MRGLPARRIASTVLCSCLLTGITGPLAAAAEPAHQRPLAVPRTPTSDNDALLAQTRDLGDVLGILTPVTALLNAVLKADNGQLQPAQAQKLTDAVKEALAALPATTALPAPAAPALPKSDPAPAPDAAGTARADLAGAVDALLAASTSGDAGSGNGTLDATVKKLVQGLVDVIAAALATGGLPAPSLTGLAAPSAS
ncbi:hypothetical protein ACIQU5_05380 [Streptomyces sp. NPDC090306]|uniref:hypothetical protein n=1 Tax=Streptomyces sp. NPDC090306 TaxID=3365961 RepID=UPI0037F67E4B